ncbi:hypothetical protein J6590_024032 [Homalodisca vitripennis]|nr:hypothetical protein J6590_024032 [Homalodisca vitripennis]
MYVIAMFINRHLLKYDLVDCVLLWVPEVTSDSDVYMIVHVLKYRLFTMCCGECQVRPLPFIPPCAAVSARYDHVVAVSLAPQMAAPCRQPPAIYFNIVPRQIDIGNNRPL